MQSFRATEILVGLFMVFGFIALFVLAMQVSNLASYQQDESYTLEGRFDNVGGLTVRSPVKAGGVTVGRVSEIGYDNEYLEPYVKMAIDSRYNQFPLDTSAAIFTSGLLGEQYIALQPGAELEALKDGDRLQITQSAVILEQLIGQFLYQQANK